MKQLNTLPAHASIAIVGAGPIGIWLALSLAQAGYPITLLEAQAPPYKKKDARTLALSWGSLQHFNQLGMDRSALNATDIHHIDITQKPRWSKTLLTHQDVGLDYLGAVVEYTTLIDQLRQKLQNRPKHLQLFENHRVEKVSNIGKIAHVTIDHLGKKYMLTADVVILAEGGTAFNITPHWPKHSYAYEQRAIAAQVTLAKPAQHTAYEYFSVYGPLALLPYGKEYRLLWIRTAPNKEQCDDQTIWQNELQSLLGQRFGDIQHFQATQQFILTLKEANTIAKDRIALVGAAAQTLHPIAGQGLNLGLRDASALLASLMRYPNPEDFAQALQEYKIVRRVDRLGTIGFTHLLAKLALKPQSAWLRSLGIQSLELFAPLRQRFTAHMVFGAPLSETSTIRRPAEK